jgi:threonine synthase
MSPLTEILSEKYLRKLIGRTEIEDALKRLDKLTQEEARMATAQVLKVTHNVDDRVKAVDDKVVVVIDGASYIFNQPLIQCLTRCACA